jgi:hypothetical protein
MIHNSGNRWSLLFAVMSGTVLSAGSAVAAKPTAPVLPPPVKRTVSFRQDVYPLLRARCFKCHQGSNASSGYRLDLRAELLGQTGGTPLVQIGASARSRLIHLVAGRVPDKVMPQAGPRLSPEQVGLLRAWIDQGLKWDDQLLPPSPSRSRHWAFQPVKAPTVPWVKNAGWVRNPIDAFIAARHEARGLVPAPEAERRVLVRRLFLDLIGLPPRPDEVEAFLADRAPGAYVRLVERLLASPHYGERWGRHWLDVARWAESEGYESNHLRPHAWRYRDFVVHSFNADKPFPHFVRQQIAGDEMVPYADENLISTGFLAAARLSSNEEDMARQRNDVLVDVVNATGSAFLGLTLNCAQCHRHKFDPLTAKDYYRLLGFFVKGQPGNLALKDPSLWTPYLAARPPDYEAARKLQGVLLQEARARLLAEVRKTLLPEEARALAVPEEKRTARQEELARQADLKLQVSSSQTEKAVRPEVRRLYEELKKRIAFVEKTLPPPPQTFGFYSPATSPHRVEVLPMQGFYPLPYEPERLARARPHLLISGEVHRRGPEVDVGWPEVFGPVPREVAARPSRLALADWLTGPRHPLTARVWVNRLWHYHFGRGLVATPGDFGRKGAPCTHPGLLDWLATELVRGGWSTKHLHRLIVCSSTYRQSSRPHAGNARIDPDNALWWHWQSRRLEAEVIRDSMLAVSGELDRTVGGPSLSEEKGPSRRRGLYLFQKREKPPALQGLFDGPAAILESCPRRPVSTVPLQALYLLNNEFGFRRARAFARRVQTGAGADRERQVETAFRLALGRAPDRVERAAARHFFQAAGTKPAGPTEPAAALVHFCQALLNVNEFVYLE